jgi:hypothetical protein
MPSPALLRRAVVGAVLAAQVVVVGVVSSYAGGAGTGQPGVVPTLPPLPVLAPSPSPSAKPSPKPAPKPTPKIAPPQDRWALLFGVTDYKAPTHDTVAGAHDAEIVRDTLLRAGWRSDHIRILTNGAATGKALQDGLTWLISHSSDSTFSLFHYSGHVKQRDGHEYLWSVDNSFYADSSVTQAMRSVRGVSWTDIAGCESAGFNDGLADSKHLFTASSAVDEKSYENPDWKMSVWVGLLFDQGIRRGGADANGDHHVTVQEAFGWAAPRAAQITRDQRPFGPQHPYLAGGSGALRLDAPVVG